MSEDLAIPSKPINPRYYSLDIWRGLACLMIVLLHASFLFKTETAAEHRHDPAFAPKILAIFTRMQIGVPLFFVISGYCISATADASRPKSRAGPDYFKRRLCRNFPPYWVVLIGAILLYGMIAAMHPSAASSPGAWYEGRIPVIGHFLPSQWFGNFTLTEMWRYHVAGAEANMLMSPSWTLCYEEQFYVVCGLILLAMPRRLFGGLLVISAATAVTLGFSFYRGTYLPGFFFDGSWLEFPAGGFLYSC